MFNAPNTPFGGGGGGFGQSTNTAPAFGSPAPAPGGIFGTPAPSAFGAPAPAPGFGAPAAPSAFGAPAPAGGGLFGSAPAPAAGAFGAPAPAFGAAPAPSGGIFGAPAPAAPTFGSPPAPAPGLFGAAPAAQSSPFGAPAPAPTSAFGAPAAPSPFGAPAPATGAFGAPAPTFGAAPAPSGGIFGTTAPAPTSAFGTPAPAAGGGMFGAAAPSPGIFGSPAPGAPGTGGGTRAVPYQVTTKADGQTSINLQAITAMQQYQDKSFEELRFEDYSQGNRGSASSTPTAGNTTTGFGFAAAPAPATGSLFGSTATSPAPSTAFGAPAAPTFGAAPAPAFGAPAPAPFGAPAPAPFGAPAPAAGGLFGTTPAPAPFGAPAPAAGGLFGSATPAPAPFGAPAPAPFGAPAPAAGGLFGTTPAPAPFGAPAPAAGGLFGSTAPSPAPFGAPAPAAGGIFGSPAPAIGAPVAGFGAKPAGGGIFGAPAAPAFGAAPATSSLFGATPAAAPTLGAPQQPATGAGGLLASAANIVVIPPVSNEVVEQQLRALDNQRKEMEKAEVWNGNSSTPRSNAFSTTTTSLPDSSSTSLAICSVPQSPYTGLITSSTSPSASKLRPRGFPKMSSSPPKSLLKNTLGRDNTGLFSPETQARSSVMRLVIKPESLNAKSKLRLRLNVDSNSHQSPSNETAMRTAAEGRSGITSPTIVGPIDGPPNEGINKQPANSSYAEPEPSPREASDPAYDYYKSVIKSSDPVAENKNTRTASPESKTADPAFVPKLTKKGYTATPSTKTLAAMTEAELAAVENFGVKNEKYGTVDWLGAVDVRGADLDRIVSIEHQDVGVYVMEESDGTKPKVGSKLNRPAIITFYDVFPKKGGSGASDDEKNKFARKIERKTAKIGAEFISYDQTRGVWKIKVEHFSRYGLDSDDESETDGDSDRDEDAEMTNDENVLGLPKSILKQKQTPYKRSRITFEENTDLSETVLQEEIDAALVSDVDLTEKEIVETVQSEAKKAAKEVFTAIRTQKPSSAMDSVPKPKTWDEEASVEDDDSVVEESPFRAPTNSDIQQATNGRNITAMLAQKAGVASPSVAIGNHRSFRVGWHPDGSFIKLNTTPSAGGSPALTKCRPRFKEPSAAANKSASLLETWLSFSTKSSLGTDNENDCCLFELPQAQENSGSAESHRMLFNALMQFSTSVNDHCEETKNAFLLLAYLLESLDSENMQGKDKASQFASRRVAAILKWLVGICSPNVEKEIRATGDAQNAVFAALSGGDLEKACDLAANAGLPGLAAALASGVDGRAFLLSQTENFTKNAANASKMHSKTHRCLSDVSGDSEFEKKLFQDNANQLDWLRHLVLRLLPEPPNEDMTSLFDHFASDVTSGLVPFPHAQYQLSSSSNGVNSGSLRESIFYRLLRLLCSAQYPISVLETVDPSGFTTIAHDFEVPFHLGSAIVAATETTSKKFTPFQTEYILAGYETQLASQGLWEWAVFVSLCSFGGQDQSFTRRWKIDRAKNLVLRHFDTEGDPLAQRRRSFLEEKVGVPPQWFHEAIGRRFAAAGNLLKYVKQALDYNPSEARSAIENLWLPNLFFMGQSKAKTLMDAIKMAGYSDDDGLSLAMAMYQFYLLDDQLVSVANKEHIQEAELSELLFKYEHIEKTLLSTRETLEQYQGSSTLQMTPNFDKVVPLSSMIFEALQHLACMKSQCEALKLRGAQMQI